jgi:hypothetical protein
MRYWVCGLLLSLTLAGAFACSDGPADEKDENGDGGDFDDVDEAACACEETCLLAEFDCAATCTGFDSACVDDCRADYTACALACGGCIRGVQRLLRRERRRRGQVGRVRRPARRLSGAGVRLGAGVPGRVQRRRRRMRRGLRR